MNIVSLELDLNMASTGDRTLVGAMLMLSQIDPRSFDLLGLTGGVGTFGDPRTYGVTLEYKLHLEDKSR